MNGHDAHWVAGAEGLDRRASVEKPPVGSVEKAWARASKGLIASSIPVQPNTLRISTIATVSPT